jgi:hypothetical protein
VWVAVFTSKNCIKLGIPNQFSFFPLSHVAEI